MGLVVFQVFLAGFVQGISREGDFAGVHFVIDLAIMVFTFEMFTDFEIVIGGYCDISFVEKFVDICAQEQSIIDFMKTSQAIGFNMGGFKCRYGMFFSNSTLLISPFNSKPKRTLSQTRVNQLSRTIPGNLFCCFVDVIIGLFANMK